MLFGRQKKLTIPAEAEALPGRSEPITPPSSHFVNGNRLSAPWPKETEIAMFGLGCFWGAERLLWRVPGVYSTQVGYAGGSTPNPTYQEVCSGMTGHNEVVRVVFDPAVVSFADLLTVFFENHDPTQGMRQGNDVGTQYRSGVYPYDDTQRATAAKAAAEYNGALAKAGHAAVTSELVDAPTFYFAEEYHQQYLAKNPGGYCSIGGTGVCMPGGA
ncbi:MAG: peptide-methionine (S)-S-oxide reductase [Myxococcota bacterium]|jgi:peptide-methionine (S)-S-oxide reductase